MSHQQQQANSKPASDWSATQYLKFGNERTRPVRDLVSNIALQSPKRIIDLGCGPGNSSAVLASRWPNAQITGIDASPNMLQKARANLPGITFELGDLHTFQPGAGADLLFSNAVFHWFRREQRIPTILRLLESQNSGGVLAFQVPDNYAEPSHKAMREVARQKGPWKAYFDAIPVNQRPDLDPIETAAEWYNALMPACEKIDIWHSLYQHVMRSPNSIVEWVKGSGLMPFLNVLPSQEVKDAFSKAYEQRLGQVYPKLEDGKVLLRYPRLFIVATRT